MSVSKKNQIMVSQTSPLAGMKPKDAIKLGTVPLDI